LVSQLFLCNHIADTFVGALTPLSASPDFKSARPESGDWPGIPLERHDSDEVNRNTQIKSHSDSNIKNRDRQTRSLTPTIPQHDGPFTERSISPPPLPTKEAIERAMALSKQLSASNIPSQVTETGDLMLDMTGYKSSDDDALRAEVIARKILSEELEGNYDIGALIGADEHGNLWIYSSEEAKEAATQRALMAGIQPGIPPSPLLTSDAASDPGYHSDGENDTAKTPIIPAHRRSESDQGGLTPPQSPPDPATAGDPNRNYAKTLRLTSDQLKALGLKAGSNPMSFTVNRATCQAYMYLWRYDVPIVISDIDGTITKSDALGHVLNMIGRDWTHIGVAKLYTEIVANGYNIMYLTSRSVGQADTTRAYLNGVVQDGYRLPKGPTIMSPDRTIAALRRELYIRKPEVFKMACLRDIKNLFGPGRSCFYAGFGNRLTDALSYRSVSIPSNRIFTINSNAEVSLDLLSLNKLKLSYVNMREVVDHYFPPVSTLVKGGGEEFTDFTYWRDTPLDLEDFSGSDDEDDKDDDGSEDDGEEEYDDEGVGEMGDSYISQASVDENGNSILSGSAVEDEEEDDVLTSSMLEADDDVTDELTPALETLEGEDEKTQVLPALDEKRGPGGERTEDADAEIITGMKGIALERGDSQPEDSD
jgi:phosphatidate phosphatase LPIN